MARRKLATESASDALLLIEGHSEDATKILTALAGDEQPRVEWVKRLSDGLRRIERPGVQAILVNLFLPDSDGIETFDKVQAVSVHTPILVLCGTDNENIGKLAVKRGADDFLLKTHFDRYSLTRAVRSMLDRNRKDEALFVEKERAEITLNSIGDAVLSTDVSGNVTYLNTVAEVMTGWSRGQAAGRPLAEIFRIIDGATRQPSEDPMALAVRESKTVFLKANCILVRRDGIECQIEDSAAPIRDRRGRLTGAVIVFHDVSAARQISLQLTHMAQHDVLTDLPNRTLLNDRINQAIALAVRNSHRVAVLFLDMDRFKRVNDSLGHTIGDQLLQAVATRLTSSIRRSDTVGRQGGDEFIVLLSELASAEDTDSIVAKLLTALAMPYHIGSHDVRLPVSIGVSLYPDDAQDAETLIDHADTAMYYAKEHGGHKIQHFKREMVVRAVERQFIESSLRFALERQEFSLHYQPKMDLNTGAMVGVEALLRWEHPERGFIPPIQFVSIAEDSGLILPIGQWVLREACRQSRVWLDAGLQVVPVAVNISAIEFRSEDFEGGVCAILEESGLDARYLELELTESVLMKHAESTVSMLQSLKDIGVHLTVDDFGTGYSSLSYLKQFPIDALKVDQSFVREISSKSDHATIVCAVISMGHSLKKRVIAEGVETSEQLDFLTEVGCQEGQGYYFNRPMVPDRLATLLQPGVRQ